MTLEIFGLGILTPVNTRLLFPVTALVCNRAETETMTTAKTKLLTADDLLRPDSQGKSKAI